MSTLNDKVIVVTGGSQGFGLAIARALIAQGAKVGLISRSQKTLDKAVQALGAGTAFAAAADVADPAAVKQAVDAIAAHFGRIDGLVNNAGIARPDPLAEVSAADFNLMWGVNVGGVLWSTQAVLPWLRKSDNPRIVTITSASARHDDEMSHLGIYASTKAAVERLMIELRQELLVDGIGVTSVSPGFAATDFAAGWDFAKLQRAAADWRKRSPGFFDGMTVDDIGAAVAHCFAYPRGVAVDFMEVRPVRPQIKPEF